MTRNSIVERLLDQGHITITWADIILNLKDRCIGRITELHTDGNINTNEAVLLIKNYKMKNQKENITELKDKIESQKEVILNLKMELLFETNSKEVARRGLRQMYKKYQVLLLNADELSNKLEKHINR
jgi:hypothetical protein